MGGKTPRIDPYDRLNRRFYETLIFLSLIKKVQGSHYVASHNSASLVDTRRRFLKNLAFICDYKKGGSSTTAIAVEERQDRFIYWVASNEGATIKVVHFLTSVFEHLKQILGLPIDRRAGEEAAFASRCTEFAAPRIRKESRILANAARKCRSSILSNTEHGNSDLASWLQCFESTGHQEALDVCQLAYKARGDQHMKTLEKLSIGLFDGTDAGNTMTRFRHILGRLAAHIRVTQQLLEDGSRVQDLLDVYAVNLLERPESAPLLEADPHTNLRGILRRLPQSQKAEFREVQDLVLKMNEQSGLEDTIIRNFKTDRVTPRVHAEVQMLDHFARRGRIFAARDRYIAASKPACFCCTLYFRHHPLRCEQPDSHNKIYPKWGPSILVGGKDDPDWLRYRGVLQMMIYDMGGAIDDHIRRQFLFGLRRADSLTEITKSDNILAENSDSEAEVDDGTKRLDNGYIAPAQSRPALLDETDGDSGSDGGGKL